MQFKSELFPLILNGQKTQTRRPVKPNVSFRGTDIGWKPCAYSAGRTYGVQLGRGRRALARIEVTGVHKERVGDITLEDAEREGFKDIATFFRYWKTLYPASDLTEAVWVITFYVRQRAGVKAGA